MNFSVIFRVFGVLLMAYSVTMLPPVLVALIYSDEGVVPFLCAFALTLSVGLCIWSAVSNFPPRELRAKDGFFIVVMFWTLLSFFGALPIYLFQNPDILFTDAMFEAVSGLTTTGSTVLSGLDDMPKSLLYHRQQLQWLGGMGIIVLAVAILPMLGVGGMQLYRAETPGPMKDSKLTPRITETAKALWYIYLALTITCALCYWFAGMSAFDAIGHSFSTVATGGLSTHDQSIGYFNSIAIEAVCVFFMFISSCNFALHFACWQNKALRHYIKDSEVRFYFFALVSIIIISALFLWYSQEYSSIAEAFRYSVFEVVTVASSSGFGTADFSHWPALVIGLLFITSFMGGCAGSTSGGIKVIRVLLIFKLLACELKKLIHPASVSVTKVGNKPVSERIVGAVSAYLGAYLLVFMILLMAVLATGLDFVTGFSVIASALNNLGPALGDAASNFGSLPIVTKWVLCLGMLLGRLEIFPILVLFTPWFWRS